MAGTRSFDLFKLKPSFLAYLWALGAGVLRAEVVASVTEGSIGRVMAGTKLIPMPGKGILVLAPHGEGNLLEGTSIPSFMLLVDGEVRAGAREFPYLLRIVNQGAVIVLPKAVSPFFNNIGSKFALFVVGTGEGHILGTGKASLVAVAEGGGPFLQGALLDLVKGLLASE